LAVSDNRKEVVAMSLGTIFGLQPFKPKYLIFLPSEGNETMLFVLDGKAFPAELQARSWPRRIINSVHFEGWAPPFENPELDIPAKHLVDQGSDSEHYVLEVAFRLVPSEVGPTAEIVAVSYDGGETFYDNKLSTLPQKYDHMETKAD
jgi:hypothetical protein